MGDVNYHIYNRTGSVHTFSTVLDETEKNMFAVNINVPVLTDLKVRIITSTGSTVGYPTVLVHTREIIGLP
jgi:hypothetical protein